MFASGLIWDLLELILCLSEQKEGMFRRTLLGKERALSPKHTSTLDTVNNLGTLFAEQGKLAEAEAMY